MKDKNYRQKYLKRAKIAGGILRLVPFIKMAGLNGSVVRGQYNKESDIDFLIIAKAGRLYTARVFATFFIHLTGWRRHGDKIAGRICLNCYLSDKNPDIAPKDKKSRRKVAESNKYLVPLVDAGGMTELFFEKNKWFGKCGAWGVGRGAKIQKQLIPNGPRKPIKIFELFLRGRFGDYLEKKLMNYQRARILAGKKPGDETVASVREIRLHPKKR